ncbi:MAG: PAS domain S-box protein [Verrucomicrobiaceae bacterium]|nr:PAS domain S-box protein [Verrucomicrobiaceae bacterium]
MAVKEMNQDQRALVIDGNAANRRMICEVLSLKGYEVSACDSIAEAKKFFRLQELVLAGSADDKGEIQSFVDYVRDEAGSDQPYIIAVDSGRNGSIRVGNGVNDVLPSPVESESLELKVEAAKAWLANHSPDTSEDQQRGKVEGKMADEGAGKASGLLFDPETAELAESLLGDSNFKQFETEDSGDAQQKIQEKAINGRGLKGEDATRVRRGRGSKGGSNESELAARHNLHLMVEACPVAMAMLDQNMRYLIANLPWRKAFGIADSGFSGKSHFELFSEVSERWRALCEDCLDEVDEQIGEELVEWADGAMDWVRWTMTPWLFEGGAVGGIVVSAHSITGEKRLRREQQFEGDIAEAVMASSTTPVLVLDVNGQIVRSNRVAKRLGNWDPVVDEGKYYWEAFLDQARHREAKEQFMEFSRNLLEGGNFRFPESSVDEVCGHDGRNRRIIWTNSPRRGADGEITGIIRVGFDVDRFSDPGRDEQLKATMLADLAVPAWRCNPAGEIDLVNAAWLKLRGRSLEQELNGGWVEGFAKGDADVLSGHLRAAVSRSQAFSMDANVLDVNGDTVRMRFSANPSAEDAESCIYGVAVNIDAENKLSLVQGELEQVHEGVDELEGKAARFEAELAASKVELKRFKAESNESSEQSNRFRLIPDSAPFGIVLLARDGETTYCNPAHQEVVGSDIGDYDSIEDWLSAHCRSDGKEAAKELVEEWRNRVWRQGAIGIFSIKTDDGIIRELEFRPKLMEDGGLLLSIFDVTDALRGEEALRASEAKFRALFHDSGVGMALADEVGDIMDVNASLQSMLGFSKAEIRGKSIDDFIYGFDRENLGEFMDHLAGSDHGIADRVIELATSDGERVEVHLQASRVKDKAGALMFTTYFIHDISGQLLAQRKLEDSRAENRALLDASPDMTLVLEDSGRVVDVFLPVGFSLQVDSKSCLGHEIEEVLPALGMSSVELIVALGNAEVFTRNFRTEGADGVLHYELRATRSGSGNTVMLVRDVTQMHRAQIKLKWQAVTFTHIHDAIVVADLKGRVIDWNPSAERLFGYTKDTAAGIGLHQIFGSSDPVRFRDVFTNAIRNKGRWEARAEFLRNDGSKGVCDTVFIPLQDEDGASLALVGVNREIVLSEEEQSAGDQNALRVRAEMQSRLDATLKTISTLLSLQEKHTGGAALQASRSRVGTLALLHSLVDSSGDYSRLNFGEFANALINELLEHVAPEETEIEVHLHAKGIFLPVALAMPVALIANELISNAFIHGCMGRDQVTVGFSIQADESVGRGELIVKNDGVALPPDFSIESSGGLGLQIVRELAGRIDGRLEVGSGSDPQFRVGFKLPDGG